MRPHLLFVYFLCFVRYFHEAETIKVAVYYESLCPGSIEFITTQLFPSYPKISSYINLDLVPFGKAQADNSSGHWEFQCQHGPFECYNNKVHSCVIASNAVASSVEFINCAMSSNPYSNSSLKQCAQEANITWTSVETCLNTGRGDVLLAENGVKTGEVTPKIAYIPTIVFDDVYNKNEDQEAQEHFFKLVCRLLDNKPEACKSLVAVLLQIIL